MGQERKKPERKFNGSKLWDTHLLQLVAADGSGSVMWELIGVVQSDNWRMMTCYNQSVSDLPSSGAEADSADVL